MRSACPAVEVPGGSCCPTDEDVGFGVPCKRGIVALYLPTEREDEGDARDRR